MMKLNYSKMSAMLKLPLMTTTSNNSMFSTNNEYNKFFCRFDVDVYAEVNQKQDDVVLQQNEAYCTQVQLQQNVCNGATSASTNDKPTLASEQSTNQVQLQQNECYVASYRGNKDKTDE